MIVLLVGLVLIAVIVVLNAVVFTVRSVSVDFDTENSVTVEEGLADKIIAASGIKKGKNIFGVSESKMVKNIEASVPGVRVVNIERKFPDKVIIHVSQRVPVYLINYKQSQSSMDNYVLVDSEMVVLDILDLEKNGYTEVLGFTLLGRYEISVGKTLPVAFGDEIYYLQNIAAGFYNQGLTPSGFVTFVDNINFNGESVDVLTNSGVTIRLGAKLTSAELADRITKAYLWYTSQEDGSTSLKEGMAVYNGTEYVWNTY